MGANNIDSYAGKFRAIAARSGPFGGKGKINEHIFITSDFADIYERKYSLNLPYAI